MQVIPVTPAYLLMKVPRKTVLSVAYAANLLMIDFRKVVANVVSHLVDMCINSLKFIKVQ